MRAAPRGDGLWRPTVTSTVTMPSRGRPLIGGAAAVDHPGGQWKARSASRTVSRCRTASTASSSTAGPTPFRPRTDANHGLSSVGRTASTGVRSGLRLGQLLVGGGGDGSGDHRRLARRSPLIAACREKAGTPSIPMGARPLPISSRTVSASASVASSRSTQRRVHPALAGSVCERMRVGEIAAVDEVEAEQALDDRILDAFNARPADHAMRLQGVRGPGNPVEREVDAFRLAQFRSAAHGSFAICSGPPNLRVR